MLFSQPLATPGQAREVRTPGVGPCLLTVTSRTGSGLLGSRDKWPLGCACLCTPVPTPSSCVTGAAAQASCQPHLSHPPLGHAQAPARSPPSHPVPESPRTRAPTHRCRADAGPSSWVPRCGVAGTPAEFQGGQGREGDSGRAGSQNRSASTAPGTRPRLAAGAGRLDPPPALPVGRRAGEGSNPVLPQGP